MSTMLLPVSYGYIYNCDFLYAGLLAPPGVNLWGGHVTGRLCVCVCMHARVCSSIQLFRADHAYDLTHQPNIFFLHINDCLLKDLVVAVTHNKKTTTC